MNKENDGQTAQKYRNANQIPFRLSKDKIYFSSFLYFYA